MKKINVLLENYPDDLMEVVETLYREKFPKKSKSFCIIKVGDIEYDNRNFQDTYIEFLTDFHKFLSNESLSKILGTTYAKSLDKVKIKAKDEGYFKLIDNKFYINVKSSTSKKLSHILKISDYLRLDLDYEFFEPAE